MPGSSTTSSTLAAAVVDTTIQIVHLQGQFNFPLILQLSGVSPAQVHLYESAKYPADGDNDVATEDCSVRNTNSDLLQQGPSPIA